MERTYEWALSMRKRNDKHGKLCGFDQGEYRQYLRGRGDMLKELFDFIRSGQALECSNDVLSKDELSKIQQE